MVNESILDSVKAMHGIESDDTSFDKELIMHINGALMVMTELGVGPIAGYSITGKDQTWTDFLQGRTDLDLVFNDVYLRVKLIFDPPQSGTHVQALESLISEFEWRLMVAKDPVPPVQPLF